MTYQTLWTEATTAAHLAGTACHPVPMTVVQRDDQSRIVYSETVPDGLCGFAWVKIRPANGAFVRWLKARNIGHKAYAGGWEVSISGFGQSHARKVAAAHAMAKVLRDAGLDASSYDRLD